MNGCGIKGLGFSVSKECFGWKFGKSLGFGEVFEKGFGYVWVDDGFSWIWGFLGVE